MDNWNRLKQPPGWALKTIQAGRLKGKSDINPQWRYQAMTEVYGECGCGWKYSIEKLWTEPGPEDQVFAFAQINLQIKCDNDEWSAPIPGVGGHMLVVKEKSGPYANDEAYKMAITDALSTAMKMLGVASDIYAGLWDGAKYAEAGPAAKPEPKKVEKKQVQRIQILCQELGINDRNERMERVNRFMQHKFGRQVESTNDLYENEAKALIEKLYSMTQQEAANANA
jgi:hypothetical protein